MKKQKWLPKAEYIKKQKEAIKYASTPEEKEALLPKNKARTLLNEMTEQFLQALKEKPVWDSGHNPVVFNPFNLHTGKPYKGVNWFYLSMKIVVPDSAFCTFAQARLNEWKVKKGCSSYPIIYARRPYTDSQIDDLVQEKIEKHIQKHGAIDTENKNSIQKQTEKTYLRPVFSVARVFNRADLIIPPELESAGPTPLAPPQGIVKSIIKAHNIKFINSLASNNKLGCYLPATDTVMVRAPEGFKDSDAYHRTCLHEFTHWAGDKKRAGSEGGDWLAYMNNPKARAKEELIAEFGSWILCSQFGFKNKTRHTDYLRGYYDIVKNDRKTLTECIKQAQKRVDYLLQPLEKGA